MLAGRFLGLHRALEDGGTVLRREAVLLDLLLEIAGPPALRLNGGPPSVRENAAIRRAREFLDGDGGERVSLRALAALAGMSPFHFHRLFRRQTGLPPHEYLIRRRLLRARALLRRGEPASGVAAETGFADQSHLTRHFKRLLGLAPAAYARGRETARTFKTARTPDASLRACGNGRVSSRSPLRVSSL
jgi:AraC-like DNA-binding protein